MQKIKTKQDIEFFVDRLIYYMGGLPENFQPSITLDKEDFHKLKVELGKDVLMGLMIYDHSSGKKVIVNEVL